MWRRRRGCGGRPCRCPSRSRPFRGLHRAVATLGLGSADCDELQAIGTGLECADGLRRDAHHIPLAELDDLAVNEHPPVAGNDDVSLLLLAVLVAVLAAEVRRIAEVADAEVPRAEVLAAEATLDSFDPAADGILDLKQIDVAERSHWPLFSIGKAEHALRLSGQRSSVVPMAIRRSAVRTQARSRRPHASRGRWSTRARVPAFRRSRSRPGC